MSIAFQAGDLPEFTEWPKIPRLNRDVTITEKIDGSNAAIWISDDGSRISAQSRTRWINPKNDNFGFAGWVDENREELSMLGPGTHFGEWFGRGIQRGYGMQDRRFALFNTHRWNAENTPTIVGVVPVLWQGSYQDLDLGQIMVKLREGGSVAVPGFAKAEGVVMFHAASGQMFKVLLEGDELPKGITTRREREVQAELQGGG